MKTSHRSCLNIWTLVNLEAVTSAHNVKGLSRLYDTVESNVRSLKSLGVESSTYGTLLAGVLFNKLPQDIQLIVSRKTGASDWKLSELIGEELEARERDNCYGCIYTGEEAL